MNRSLTIALLCLVAAAGAGAAPLGPALDSVYQFYAAKDYPSAYSILERLDAETLTPADRFRVRLEIGDYLLDKQADYAGAESAYAALVKDYPKQKQLPDVIYRLALALELQENYLEAAKNYEIVATKYSKSTYGNDALDAIERCFRKNYQERVAYVDSYPITRIEIDDRIGRNPAAYESYDKKLGLLDTMIDNRLLYAAALKSGVEKDPTFAFTLNDARNRAMFQEWYERNVTAKSKPTDKEVKAAYQKDLPTRYTTPEKVHLFQIQVATKDEADKVRAELVADTTARAWDSIAKQVSTAPDKEKGGDLGLVARGSQPKPIEDAAFALKVGSVSQPVALSEGFAIIKVTEKKPKSVRAFADVKNQLAADLAQQNAGKGLDDAIAALKAAATISEDTTAIDQGKDTLAVVNGIVIDTAALMARLNAIPPFYRANYDSPEGKRKILDNLVTEKLLMKEAEAEKLWLVNKVVDALMTRRAQMLIDAYKRMMTTDKVTLDSAQLMADYKATIADYREPTKVHAREITAATMTRAQELRSWAASGRLPAMLQGRALLFAQPAAELEATFAATANTDSLVAEYALAGPPVMLPGRPTVGVGPKTVPDLAQPTNLTGPYAKPDPYGFGFADLARQDRLYEPVIVKVESQAQLDSLLGRPAVPETAKTAPIDSAKLGAYVKTDKALPADFVNDLFKLDDKATAKPLATPDGNLLVKVTRKDTAQKATFQDIAKRFSKSSSRWAGGDLYWLARDDKAHDKKIVDAAFSLSKNALSPVIKLNDSSYVFVMMEEKKAAYTRPFSEVRSKIDNKLRRAQEKQLYDQLLQDLRAKAKIEIVMTEATFTTEPMPEETQPTGAELQPAPQPEQK